MNNATVRVNLCFAAGAAFASTLLLSSCNSKVTATNMTVPKLSPVSMQHLQLVSRKKIFFGHQSVGYNIVEGVGDVLKQYPAIAMNVTESTEPGVFDAPVLAHTTLGRNSDPESKIMEFAERVRGGVGDRADIAMFKFCYVDIDRAADPSRVFATYKQTMAKLTAAYPKTRFVHVTVPLKATSSGWKTYVKNVLGKPHPFVADNLRREEFNSMMRKEYAGQHPFFDLAAVESTRTDGSASFDKSDGQQVPSLANEYTYDSGHLNERGRKLVAEQLLVTLASL